VNFSNSLWAQKMYLTFSGKPTFILFHFILKIVNVIVKLKILLSTKEIRIWRRGRRGGGDDADIFSITVICYFTIFVKSYFLVTIPMNGLEKYTPVLFNELTYPLNLHLRFNFHRNHFTDGFSTKYDWGKWFLLKNKFFFQATKGPGNLARSCQILCCQKWRKPFL
jgi:hypothetical protein